MCSAGSTRSLHRLRPDFRGRMTRRALSLCRCLRRRRGLLWRLSMGIPAVLGSANSVARLRVRTAVAPRPPSPSTSGSPSRWGRFHSGTKATRTSIRLERVELLGVDADWRSSARRRRTGWASSVRWRRPRVPAHRSLAGYDPPIRGYVLAPAKYERRRTFRSSSAFDSRRRAAQELDASPSTIASATSPTARTSTTRCGSALPATGRSASTRAGSDR